jgi:branched-chain amino acid aminotransferase
MININGTIVSKEDKVISHLNRGYTYGDAVFETIKVVNSKVFFLEQHYFRLMSSMRILRMSIPMATTMEFVENEILKVIKANNLENKSARVRITVDRGDRGKYLPKFMKNTSFIVCAEELESPLYNLNTSKYIVDLYKDHYVAPGLLSTVKTTNRVINVIGSIYAQENDLDNCLLLNTDKKVIEALNGNIFLVKGNIIKTPPILDGCIKGIIRGEIISIMDKLEDYTLQEVSISAFEL